MNSDAVSDQRPCTVGVAPRRRAEKLRRRSARAFCDHGAAARELRRAQRRPGVVGRLAGPHEVPQRLDQLLGRHARDVGQQVGEEARAGGQASAQRVVHAALGSGAARAGRRAAPRPRGSRSPRGRSGGRAARRRPTRARRPRTAGRATTASTRRCGAAARRAPTRRPAAPGPAAARARRAGGRSPRPEAGWRSTPCQLGMKRASARWSAGSISLRRAASEARRSRRSTSGSHHSRRVPPGRSSPRTSSPARSRPASTGVRSSP